MTKRVSNPKSPSQPKRLLRLEKLKRSIQTATGRHMKANESKLSRMRTVQTIVDGCNENK
jgi:hypothetical protein